MIKRIQLWLFMWKNRKEAEQRFQVGDTVFDTWDQEYTVMELDSQTNHGIGLIRIKRKKDGFLCAQGFACHDLTHARKKPNRPAEPTTGLAPGRGSP